MKCEIGNLRFRFEFSVTKLVAVTGINSSINDTKNHILLWDFDDTPLEQIRLELMRIQRLFDLPHIHVIASSFDHFHAYCFQESTFSEALFILSQTKNIDKIFFKMGVIRGHWTLRITPKLRQQKFEYVCRLISNVPENCELVSQLNTVKYVTGVY